jgi:hypothetical protein
MSIPPSVIKGLFSTSITWLSIYLISSNRFNLLNFASYLKINIRRLIISINIVVLTKYLIRNFGRSQYSNG